MGFTTVRRSPSRPTTCCATACGTRSTSRNTDPRADLPERLSPDLFDWASRATSGSIRMPAHPTCSSGRGAFNSKGPAGPFSMLTYIGAKGTDLGRFRRFNTPAHVETGENLPPRPGDLQSLRTFPDLGPLFQREHLANSIYHSLQIKGEKRYSARSVVPRQLRVGQVHRQRGQPGARAIRELRRAGRTQPAVWSGDFRSSMCGGVSAADSSISFQQRPG